MPLMKYRISVTLEFLREMKHLSKRYKSLKEDLRNFGNDLLLNPEQGVSLGNNLRKIRMPCYSHKYMTIIATFQHITNE